MSEKGSSSGSGSESPSSCEIAVLRNQTEEGDMYNQPHSSSMASGASASRPPLSPSAAEGGGPSSHSRHTSASSTNSSSSSNNRLSIAERNQAFLESLNRARDDKSPENPAGSYIEDLDMFDEELVMMATKDLNSLLKKRNVAKPRQKDIKQRRRTLKNRGYAANCRVKRDDEEEELLEQIEGHERKLEALGREKQQLQLDRDHLQRKLAIQDQEDKEWEDTLKEYADYIKPGELDGLMSLSHK